MKKWIALVLIAALLCGAFAAFAEAPEIAEGEADAAPAEDITIEDAPGEETPGEAASDEMLLPPEEDGEAAEATGAAPSDAPVEIAREGDLLLPEDIDPEISGGNMESEAEGLSANAAEATGAASNRVIYVKNWADLWDEQDGDTIILSPSKGYLQQIGDPALFKGKDITLDMNSFAIIGASKHTTILYISKGGELTIAGDGTICIGQYAVFVEKGGALTLVTDRVGIKIADCRNGVYNCGNVLMTSGSITKCGCGLYNWGGAFVIKGEYPVGITGNKQGVVTYYSKTALTVSGYVDITGNSECDVLLMKDQVIQLGGPLTRGSRIGITLSDTNLPTADRPVVVTRGLKGNGTANNFVVWGDYEKRINDAGELEVCVAPSLPVAPDYTLLAKLKTSGGRALKLSWTRADGADGYDVFFGRCGEPASKKATLTGTSHKIKGLKKGVTYRAYVKAWAKDDGKKRYIGKASPNVFAIAGGHSKTRCNPKSISVNKSSLKLSVGKTAKLHAKVKGTQPGVKLLHRDRHVRFYSTDRNVATVDNTGKVKAVAAGRCKIWAMTNNGIRTAVKVKVKQGK